jgi:hypothetical protein
MKIKRRTTMTGNKYETGLTKVAKPRETELRISQYILLNWKKRHKNNIEDRNKNTKRVSDIN